MRYRQIRQKKNEAEQMIMAGFPKCFLRECKISKHCNTCIRGYRKRKRLEKKAIKGAKKAVKEFGNVFKRLKDEWKDVSRCCKAEIVDGRCDMCDGPPHLEPPEIQKEWNNYE